MKIVRKADVYKPQWYDTVAVFGELAPQPEVCIKPLTWSERAACTEHATETKMVAHPEQDGQYVSADHFNRWQCNILLLRAAVVGFKHFEDADGQPIAADDAGIDYVCEVLGAGFVLWLQKLIVTASDAAETVAGVRREALEKNS